MTNDTFLGRVTMAVLQSGRFVLTEPVGTTNHAARVALADQIVRNPQSMAPYFLPDIASNTAISAAGPVDSLDGDIDFVIGGSFDALANRITGIPVSP